MVGKTAAVEKSNKDNKTPLGLKWCFLEMENLYYAVPMVSRTYGEGKEGNAG